MSLHTTPRSDGCNDLWQVATFEIGKPLLAGLTRRNFVMEDVTVAKKKAAKKAAPKKKAPAKKAPKKGAKKKASKKASVAKKA
jgi:hypothetical protein